MVIKLKNRKNIPRKVLFYGKDGVGKSTQAMRYCKAKNLKPICVDVDETNFTEVPVVDIDLSNPLKAYTNMLDLIEEVKNSEDYDTLIIDGIGSWIQYMTPKKDPFYAMRTSRFNDVMKELRNSRINIILIAQVDFYIEDPGKEEKNNKMVVYLNGWVNEKYYCSREGSKFSCHAEKQREVN